MSYKSIRTGLGINEHNLECQQAEHIGADIDSVCAMTHVPHQRVVCAPSLLRSFFLTDKRLTSSTFWRENISGEAEAGIPLLRKNCNFNEIVIVGKAAGLVSKGTTSREELGQHPCVAVASNACC